MGPLGRMSFFFFVKIQKELKRYFPDFSIFGKPTLNSINTNSWTMYLLRLNRWREFLQFLRSEKIQTYRSKLFMGWNSIYPFTHQQRIVVFPEKDCPKSWENGARIYWRWSGKPLQTHTSCLFTEWFFNIHLFQSNQHAKSHGGTFCSAKDEFADDEWFFELYVQL